MTQINIYRSNGEWCFAAFIDGEFDVSDTLDVAVDATATEATEAAQNLYAGQSDVRVSKVADIRLPL